MLVYYSPQRSDRALAYAFPMPDRIEATLDGVTDRFDFSTLSDGAEATDIQSILDPCPVLSARRVSGRLEVVLLKFHGPDAPESERFPQPEVVWE